MVTRTRLNVTFIRALSALWTWSWIFGYIIPSHTFTVQTGPGVHPASYTMGTGSFTGVKRPGRGVDHPPLSCAKVKRKSGAVPLLPLWAFVACSGSKFTFTIITFTSWFAHLSCSSRSIQQTLFMSACAFCAQVECRRKERVTDLTVRTFLSTRMISSSLEF